MKIQTYFYIAIVCSIVAILLYATEDKNDFMDKAGIVLSVIAILFSMLFIVVKKKTRKKSKDDKDILTKNT